MTATDRCPVCNSNVVHFFKQVSGFNYQECASCEAIFISSDVLARIDAGESLVNYDTAYWTEELGAARQRSWGPALARVAEVFLYGRIPIRRFIDIGSGPGYLLDALQYQLPSSSGLFFANELFPPEAEHCTQNRNYLRGKLSDFDLLFDAGCCIEVIEHLTPRMITSLFADLAAKSHPNSLYIFNTGLPPYIKNEDPGYLDPLVRGHIMGWSLKGLQILAQPLGFKILPIPGKTWAFLAEYRPTHNFNGDLPDRIWTALPENVKVLKDEQTGDLMYVLGMETARAYS